MKLITNFCILYYLLFPAIAVPLLAQEEAASMGCELWNTEAFWKIATVLEVTDCLEAGTDPSARDEARMTPLHAAARFNENSAVIYTLLDFGADVNAQTKRRRTPLHYAAGANNPAAMDILLNAGADPNARGEDGDNPLHYAALICSNPVVIEMLLESGADAKARDDNGKTPWDYAEYKEALKDTDASWRLK